MNTNLTTVRPKNNAYNIQHGRSISCTSTKGLHSSSPSLMDDSSSPLEIDYAKRVAANCNMDIKVTYPSLSLANDITRYIFSIPPSDLHTPFKEVPNSVPISESNISTEPSPSLVIPYSANAPADPSLWDSKFTATSLFGTNKIH